jgi:hypothetical protein
MSSLKLLIILSLIYKNRGLNPADQIYDDIMSGIAPTTTNESFITIPKRYNSIISPPVSLKTYNCDSNGALPVNIEVSLRQIVSLDEKNQILTTNIYMYLYWNDPRLSWNPANYSNVQLIQIQANKVWLPDLSVMNAAGTTNLIPIISNQYSAINNFGDVTLAINLPSLQTRCPLDVKKYPFDTQKCSIIIGSWMYTTKQINLDYYDFWNSFVPVFMNSTENNYTKMDPQYSDIINYIKHPYWDLKSVSDRFVLDSSRYLMLNRWSSSYSDLHQAKDLSIDLKLVRRPLYVMINSMYINFVLNVVILLAFYMPFVVQISVCKF